MGFFHLVVTCGLMFVGPIACGLLPLLFTKVSTPEVGGGESWSEAFAAGVMLGSAIAIVLPEGFEALYSAASESDDDDHSLRRVLLMSDDNLQGSDIMEQQQRHHHHHGHGEKDMHTSPAGLAILAGFFTMLIFEMLQHRHEHSSAPQARNQLFECKGHGRRNSSGCQGHGSKELPVLLGLIVHAAADGLAVGVASVSPSVKLAVAVGMAMVLHKGPVAFGLGTFLVSQRLSASRIAQDIVLFAASSPVTAVVTYVALAQIPVFQSSAFVALAVLFSAGTFLYAACVHMLPQSMTTASLVPLVGGVLIPCTFSLFDTHHHH